MRACGASVYCSNAPCSTRHNACSSAQHSTAPLAPAERNAVSVQLGLGLAWALAPTAPCTSGCGTYLDFVLHDQLCQLRFESRPAPHALVTDPPAREYHEHPPLDTAARMAQPRAWHSRDGAHRIAFASARATLRVAFALALVSRYIGTSNASAILFRSTDVNGLKYLTRRHRVGAASIIARPNRGEKGPGDDPISRTPNARLAHVLWRTAVGGVCRAVKRRTCSCAQRVLQQTSTQMGSGRGGAHWTRARMRMSS